MPGNHLVSRELPRASTSLENLTEYAKNWYRLRELEDGIDGQKTDTRRLKLRVHSLRLFRDQAEKMTHTGARIVGPILKTVFDDKSQPEYVDIARSICAIWRRRKLFGATKSEEDAE